MLNVSRIDQALQYLALNKRYRFNAHQVAYLSGNNDVNAVYNYLVTREPYVLKRSYEVMCPNYHSTLTFDKVEDIPYRWVECRTCGEEFTPSPDMIHIVFDFTANYLLEIQEVKQDEGKKTRRPAVLT